MFSSSVQRLLFHHSGVWICRFDCPATHDRWQRENRIIDGHNVAFPETPVEIRPADHAGVVVDPSLVVFYNLGDPFRRGLIDPTGDRGNIFIFEPRHLVEALQPYDASPRATQPFRMKFAHTSSQTYLRQRLLVARVRSQPAIDPLRVVEESFEILDRVLADAHDRPIALSEPLSAGLRRQHERVDEVKRQLFDHLDHPVSLDALAKEVGASVYHLCRVFRRHTGDSIYRYSKRLRLRHGLNLLEQQRAPLADLALDVGFSQQSHFTEAFRREYGTTPGHVRHQFASEPPH